MDELSLLADADRRAHAYARSIPGARVFPDDAALAALGAFDEALPQRVKPAGETLALLDDAGSPATTRSNGGRYFGFVIGAALPEASAAERLMLAWDQCASSFDNSPVAATVERIAARWVLEMLGLPPQSAVGFGTSATACTIGCLTAARRTMLARQGWDFDRNGLAGAPEIRVVVSDLVHITVKKALRMLGFGLDRLLIAPTDATGRIDPTLLPPIDDRTILCLQAGEVNGGGFDPFATLIPAARAKGAWVHVDGAFGLWVRAAPSAAALADGVELADSWTTDGHKWLNAPYDGAMAICRDAEALAQAMNSDAVYASAAADAQKNLTLEFSRRARGIPIWAALRSLGREGVAAMVERHIAQARRLADQLAAADFDIVVPPVINQVLVRGRDEAETRAIQAGVERSGEAWFGMTLWRGAPAFRLSVSSWRTTEADLDRLVAALIAARTAHRAGV